MKILNKISSYNNKINREKANKGNIKRLYIKKNIYINLLEIVIILILFPLFFSKESRYKLTKIQFYSEIKLTIKGTGNQNILATEESDYEGPLPDQLFINGKSEEINDKMIYNFKEEYNDIILKWDSPLTSTAWMFNGVSNIIKIIVTHFDSTQLNFIDGMFCEIELLTSIDLSKFDTSLVIDCRFLFYGCTSLISVDLSNFKTSNVANMAYMFYNCESLISLDLSNFITSKVTHMGYMFDNCESLIYLNLKSFTENSLKTFDYMFRGIRNNLIYCIDKTKSPNITSAIQIKSSFNNCSDICFLQSRIILIDEQKCVSCYDKNISFPYIYNGECVQTCPKKTGIILYNDYYSCKNLDCQKYYNYNQTGCLEEIPEGYFLNDSVLKTIDKCNYNYSGKCFSECINDTNNNKLVCNYLLDQSSIKNLTFCFMKDLCNYCYNGTGYYPFYNQTILNSDTFTDCYKELEGYFLDYDNAYKPCFNTCKTCSNKGNETINNCIECKDNYQLLKDSKNNVNNCYEECDENYYYFDSLNKYKCTDECPNGFKLIKERKKCIDNCSKDDEYRYEFNNSCLIECPANHTVMNNICLKVPDIIVNSNLNIINSDSVVNSNLNIINSNSVVNSNLNIISSNSVVNSNLNIISSNSVVNSNLNIKNSNSVINSNLNIINSNSVINSNLNIKNSNSVVNSNLNIINSNSVINSTLNKIIINEKGECPKDFPYKLQNDIECVKGCNVIDIFNGICIINTKDSTVKDKIINIIRSGILNHTIDELLKDVIDGKKEGLIAVQGNTIYTLTTSDNQKNYKIKNESTIYFRECENKLKAHYNISTNDPLLIFKIDIFENGLDIEYEIYNSKTKKKLDLIYCKDIKILINIPAKIDEKNEFKYNPKSDYYKDICFAYTTEYGTDINLKDRKNEFFIKNLTICETNCDYKGFDSEFGKALCECNIKIKIPLMSEIVINKDLLISKFVDVKNYINLNVMKCYNTLFSSKGLLFNIGSYTLLAIIFLNIILLILFISKGYKNLFDKIYKIKKDSYSYKNKRIINNNNIIKTTGNSKIKKVKRLIKR